ncbi:MAG TPA: cytochrome c oxidase subunit II [Usitatibacter sp.]|nr:cytochrome c oxidase subunit II [Usitatibacter sp.]
MKGLIHALEPAGPQAAHIASLWWFALALCALVFVAVLGALFVALRRAPRATGGTPPDVTSLHAPEPGARRSVIGAVALSSVGLIALLVASVATDRALAQLSLVDAIGIEVVGHQWWWDVHYDDADPSRTFSTANELHIPVGRPVLLTLKSDDVIHSFWVPNLHGKKDLIPGRTTTLQLQADKPGAYRGQCAEFCGAQHAFMAFLVIAEAPDAYQKWAEAQRKPAREPIDPEQARGRDLFLSGSCMLCHAIQGTPANGRKAPDLTHLASRTTLAAGRLANDAGNLRDWIEDPQRFKPGVNMPAHHVPEDQIKALVTYLRSLE